MTTQYGWIGAGGRWDDGNNWKNLTTGKTDDGSPTGSDIAVVNTATVNGGGSAFFLSGFGITFLGLLFLMPLAPPVAPGTEQ